MPFWIHFVIGGFLFLGGAWLFWLALRSHRPAFLGAWGGGTEKMGASGEALASQSKDQAPLKGPRTAKMRSVSLFTDMVLGLRLDIYNSGNVNFDHWAGKIANNIYIKASKVQDAHVEDVLKPALKGQYQDIMKLDDLYALNWIRVVVNPGLMDNLRKDQRKGLTDLAEKLRALVLDSLSICITPPVHDLYEPHFSLCVDEAVGTTSFDLRFQPLPPVSALAGLDCQAAIGLKPIQAISTVPGLEETHLRVADKSLDSHAYAPLSERFAERLVIGPKSWCHLRTTPDTFDAMVTLGWRPSYDRRHAGQLQVLDYKGSDQLLLEVPGLDLKQPCRKGWYIEIPAGEGPHTMAYLWSRKGGAEENIGTLFVANPVPDIGALPGVDVLQHLDTAINGPEDFARFIATQIYRASRSFRNAPDFTFLHDEEGQAFLEQKGFLRQGNLLPDAVLSEKDVLHFRVKLVLAPPLFKKVKHWFGKIATRQSVLAQVIETVSQDAIYQEVFSQVVSSLKPDERRPGLTLDIATDNLIPRGTALMQLLPLLENEHRRDIFGEIRLDDWADARDISGVSCNPKRNFLIEYPAGSIMMRLSRYPLYGILAPQIAGHIALSLEDPGDASCRLLVENGSNSELRITVGETEVYPGETGSLEQQGQTKRLSPDQELSVPVPAGIEHQVRIATEHHALNVIIYPEPVPEMNEAEFVPAPGKLEFYGLVLGRRADTSQWQTSDFSKLWHGKPAGVDFELEGISRITGKGYVASLLRDGTQPEVHYFAGEDATLKEALNARQIKAGGHTLNDGGMGLSAQIFENQARDQVVEYQRIPMDRVHHAKVLLENFTELYFDDVAAHLPEGERLLEIDLLKCFPNEPSDLDRHLYLVKTQSRQTKSERGWVFRKGGGITRVGSGPRLQTMALAVDKAVVGPLDTKRYYTVDWQGGTRTPLSFAIENHRTQVRRYFEDGWFELRQGMTYAPGGKLAAEPKVFDGRDPQFIVTQQMKLTHNAQTVHTHNQLNFNPRELCNYFDKDAYRLGYLPEAKAFTVRSVLHPHRGLTPKTVFMVVPKGKMAVLGSHALDYVTLPKGANILVLPGLAFRFSQGPAYYGPIG